MRTARPSLLVALIVITLGLAATGPTRALAAAGDISGSLPTNGGIALAVWGGGSTAALQSSISTKGCTLQAVWYLDQQSQTFVTFVPGAPVVVNTAWNTRFTSDIAANTALIVSCRGPVPVAPPAALAESSQERDLSAQIVAGINAQRAQRGLAAFWVNAQLQTAAEQYVVMQANAGLTLNHELDGTEPWDRARAAGYPSFNVGEVIAADVHGGQLNVGAEAAKFVQIWMDSPPHRAILMTEDPKFQFTEIGMGCAFTKQNDVAIYCVGDTGKP